MNLKSPLLGLHGSTILVCLVGFAASLAPAVVYTDPFWGVRGFFDSRDSPGVILLEVDSGSPAASAGLRRGDRVVTVNGSRVEMGSFRQLLAGIRPEKSVTLDVKRGEQDVRCVTKGEIPRPEAVLFLDWQFVSAPTFLLLFLILFATQPLEPPPLWRGMVVALGGLVVMTTTTIVEVTQWLPWTAVWQSKSISHGFSPALHYRLTVASLLAGTAISILGGMAVRANLMRRAREQRARDGHSEK